MRSAVLAAPRRFQITEVPIPEPQAHEVRIRIEGCGICASDLPVWEGRSWFTYPAEPGAPGHEAWGTIDKAGSAVLGLEPGTRVAFLSFHGYSEYDVAPADHAARLPALFEGRPFPAEPLACAMNIFHRSGIEPGHTVAIVGIGFLGSLLTMLAANAGARVIAISRREFALETALRSGAWTSVRNDGTPGIVERVSALTNHRLCERVIEATGKQESLDLAAELTSVRGRMVIAGYHQDGPRSVNLQLWNWRGLDVINAHERDPMMYVDGMEAAIRAVSAGDLEPEGLFTHSFPLARLNEAFQLLHARTQDVMKSLVLT